MLAGSAGAARADAPGSAPAGASRLEKGVRVIESIPYAGMADKSRMLNLYLPPDRPAGPLPLIVLIHGGGWEAGDKDDFTGAAEEFVQRGYAAASLNYRLSNQAVFPAQIIDCKAALRWLRAHAGEYGLDPARFVVGGHSAGGHLAALVGATGNIHQFDQGANLSRSSSVQAVLWFAGVSDLIARTLVPGYEGEQDPHSGESLLVGGPVLQMTRAANAASPITYVNRRLPPYIFFHGAVDRTVPVAQAIEMYTALLRAGVPAELHILPGADHGGPGYFTPLMFDQIDAFLDKTLQRTSLSAQPMPDGVYRLSPVSAPALTLDPPGSAAPSDTEVPIGVPRLGTSGGRWRFRAEGNGYYAIQPLSNPTLALAVTPGSTTDTTRVIVMRDQGRPSQRWKVHRERDGHFLLTPQEAPGSALDDLGGSSTPGSPVDIFTAGGNDPHLQWRLTPAP